MPVTVPQGVERWEVGRLRAYDRNARTHSPEQVAQIVASIQEFGFTNPLLVAPDGEVIAGHGRLMAAQELGLGEVPVIVLRHLTPKQRRAYVIADNQLALNAGWDEELLRAELSDLEGLGFDLSLVGFSDEELSELMPKVEELDAMPELAVGDKQPLQQITFTLHDDQAELVKEAIEVAKAVGPFVDTGNENSNGNAIARVAELFLSWSSDHGVG